MAWSIQQIKDYVTGAIAAGSVPSSRTISTTAPLSGGGDLSANRTFSLLDDGVTDAKLRNSAALSIIGRATNSSGDPADITSAADGEVMMRFASALGWRIPPEVSILSTFGAKIKFGWSEEAINITGANNDSTAFLLADSSIILGVFGKIVTTISGGGVTLWRIGDPTTATRFTADNLDLTAGSGSVGLNHWKGAVATDAAGPSQVASAKLRVQCDGAPTAGQVQATVFWMKIIAY